MKLLTRQFNAYLLLTLPVLILVSIGYYYLLLGIVIGKADESLLEDKSYILSQLDESSTLSRTMLDLTDDYILQQVDVAHYPKNQFTSIMIYDEAEGAEDPYRQLRCSLRVGEDIYDLTIRKSLVEYNSIMYSILILGLVLLIALAVGFLVINRMLTTTLWKPFYQTLASISSFSPYRNTSIMLERSEIEEFEQLNQTVQSMSQKIRNDFDKQKKFIDHVAHEIQTPLTVIRVNLENLLQSHTLEESEYRYLENSLESTTKLSRITKSLLLLSRIDNNQFDEIQRINLTSLMIDYLQVHDDQLTVKNLTFEYENESPLKVNINPALAEILIGNLCRNAIRHSFENSPIKLRSYQKDHQIKLTLTNDGQPLTVTPERLFEMFQKQSKDPDSLGIGLAIVREIANRYGLQVNYTIADGKHEIALIKDTKDPLQK